ncbi:hypothetical protein GF325_17520 [Candidatus Bathyarchaeota archaeon]|nr:hypothetical protein [Candidatus Bathyarchaeota archaeon]
MQETGNLTMETASMVDEGKSRQDQPIEGEFWKSSEYKPLLSRRELKKVANSDPWQYHVADKLKNFLFRMERRKVVNFKVSGIVLHSASILCKVKSESMINKSTTIQDSLEDDLEDIDSMVDDCMAVMDEHDALYPDGTGFIEGYSLDEMLELVAEGHVTCDQVIPREKLSRFTAPKRVVARQLTMGDLSSALNDALKGKYRKKTRGNPIKDIVLPEALTRANGRELKIETLIGIILEQVTLSFGKASAPVRFVDLFVNDNSKMYIVKIFLSILHMINRKMIEAWQDDDGEIFIIPFGRSEECFENQGGNSDGITKYQ